MKTLLALVLCAVTAPQEPGPPPRPTLDQFPAPLRPYLEAAEELEGLELSLTMQVAIAVGVAVERKQLDRDWSANGEHYRDNWNEALGELLAAAGPRAETALVGGALYHDTGIQLDRSTGDYEILRRPESRFAVDDDLAERFEVRRLLAGLLTREGLSKDDAKKLEERIKSDVGELGDVDNPWIGHAMTHLMMMGIGFWEKRYDSMAEEGTPFGTADEFLAKVHANTRDALLVPMRPELDDATTADRNFRYEGDAVLVVHGADDDAWDVPDELAAVNALDHGPILVVEAVAPRRWTAKTKHERVRVGMIAGGEHRVIYDGAWPLR